MTPIVFRHSKDLFRYVMQWPIYAATFLSISACSPSKVDEKSASEIVGKELSISSPISSEKIHSSPSGARIVLVSADTQSFVVRFLKNADLQERQREIYNAKVASNGRYGPLIYFDDPKRGVVVMEYLSGKAITKEDLHSDRVYLALAHLLQKIHRGQLFLNDEHAALSKIEKTFQHCASQYGPSIPLAKVGRLITIMRKALAPHLIAAPCHNDLTLRNLIFCGREMKAIGFDDAGPEDPYVDLATVAATTEIHSRPAFVKILHSTYLERQPTEIEEAKLYLMKQLIFIKWALDSLQKLTPETAQEYDATPSSTLKESATNPLEATYDMNCPTRSMISIKALLDHVFMSSETPEFVDAINLLQRSTLSSNHIDN